MKTSSLRAVNSSAAPALFYGCSVSLVQLKKKRGRAECPFSLSTFKGSEEMSLPLPDSPGMLSYGIQHCVAGGMRLLKLLLPVRKRYFLQQEKASAFLFHNLLTLLPESKGWKDCRFRFFSMKNQFPIRKMQALQTHCFSLHGSQMYFSQFAAPCHVPSFSDLGTAMTVLELAVWDVGRHQALPVGYLQYGEGLFLLPSYVIHASSLLLSQAPSMTLSLHYIKQSWLIFSPLHNANATCIAASSERIRVYSCA